MVCPVEGNLALNVLDVREPQLSGIGMSLFKLCGGSANALADAADACHAMRETENQRRRVSVLQSP